MTIYSSASTMWLEMHKSTVQNIKLESRQRQGMQCMWQHKQNLSDALHMHKQPKRGLWLVVTLDKLGSKTVKHKRQTKGNTMEQCRQKYTEAKTLCESLLKYITRDSLSLQCNRYYSMVQLYSSLSVVHIEMTAQTHTHTLTPRSSLTSMQENLHGGLQLT